MMDYVTDSWISKLDEYYRRIIASISGKYFEDTLRGKGELFIRLPRPEDKVSWRNSKL